MTSERPGGAAGAPSEDRALAAGEEGTPRTEARRPSQPELEAAAGDAARPSSRPPPGVVRSSQRPARPSTVGEGRASLDATPIDPAFVQGADNAVRNCLGVRPGEAVVLCVDFDSDPIGAAMLAALRGAGAEVRVVRIGPGHGRNDAFLARLEQALEAADASLLVTTLDGLPPALRRRVVHAPGPKRRHGHLVGVTPAMMTQSMRADPNDIERLGAALSERLGPRSELEVSAPGGTSLRVRCDPRHRWHHESGLLRGPGWANLPSGELLTAPLSVDGELVSDGGAWSPSGEEIPNGFRLRVRFEGGLVTAIEGEAADVLSAAIDGVEHGRRVGQVGLGTNVGVVASIGELLQDLKLPGFHLMLGSTYPERTGAAWDSPVEVPLLVRRASVSIDGVSVMVGGRYVPSVFA